MRGSSVSRFNLVEHTIDIAGGVLVLRRAPNGVQLSGHASGGLAPARRVQGLADPFGDRHAAGTSRALNLAILQILQNDLQPLAHM